MDELKRERNIKIEKEKKLREERRRKERERERELREERRKAQEARERERRERARKEEERQRRERERVREIERERELRKERERKRLAQERREKEREREEKERLEKERREREAKSEKERRERQERERIEKERLDRERQERERVERERLRREKEELERIKAERERLERERLEVERRYALKRAAPPGKVESTRPEEYFPDQKRQHAQELPKGQARPVDFFGGSQFAREARVSDYNQSRTAERSRQDVSSHSDYSPARKDGSRHSSRDDVHKSRAGREPSPYSYPPGRTRERSPISTSDSRRMDIPSVRDKDDLREGLNAARDYRRVVTSRDERERSPTRRSDVLRDLDRSKLSDSRHSGSSSRGERSSRDHGSSRDHKSSRERTSSRDGEGIKYYDTEEKPHIDTAELRNPPKTLTEILERAGVSGILGSTFDQQVTMSVNDALTIAAAGRLPQPDAPDWRGERREERREDRRDHSRDSRRDDRDRPSAIERDVRASRDVHTREGERMPFPYTQSDDLSRRNEPDLDISRRAQELLAQAILPDQRSRLPPSQPVHARELPSREPSRDAIPRGYSQRGPEPDQRDSFSSRGMQRNDVPTRGFPPQSSLPQNIIPSRQPVSASYRPSSQDNWNRGKNPIPTLGTPAGFQMPQMLQGSHIRGQSHHGRDLGKLPMQGHGIPSHIRRF